MNQLTPLTEEEIRTRYNFLKMELTPHEREVYELTRVIDKLRMDAESLAQSIDAKVSIFIKETHSFRAQSEIALQALSFYGDANNWSTTFEGDNIADQIIDGDEEKDTYEDRNGRKSELVAGKRARSAMRTIMKMKSELYVKHHDPSCDIDPLTLKWKRSIPEGESAKVCRSCLERSKR